eukprot:366529-Chlamydomonas_euryale.AAC.12
MAAAGAIGKVPSLDVRLTPTELRDSRESMRACDLHQAHHRRSVHICIVLTTRQQPLRLPSRCQAESGPCACRRAAKPRAAAVPAAALPSRERPLCSRRAASHR